MTPTPHVLPDYLNQPIKALIVMSANGANMAGCLVNIILVIE